jgi:outer membrane receptor protein involved in Fe transport
MLCAIKGIVCRSAVLLLSAVMFLSASNPSLAAPSPSRQQNFDIKAQPMVQALRAWADRSRFELSWQPDGSEVPDAPAVRGRMLPEKALSQLLDGSGLTYRFVNRRLVVIHSKRQAHGDKAIEPQQGPKDDDGVSASDARKSEVSDPEFVDKILVTGSQIEDVGFAGTVFDEKEIHSGRYADLPQVLQSLTQNISGGASGASAVARLSAGPVATTNVTFAEGADLRGLGPTATLVLINGHRVTASGHGYATDLSAIPLATVKRVEVLTEGAPARFGADAIAGVVNIVLVDRFERPRSSGSYGFAGPSGRDELSLSHTLGENWDRGGVVAVGSYREQTSLNVDERDWTKGVPQPETILPATRQTSLHIAGHHRFGEAWLARVDAQLGEMDRFARGSPMPSPGALAFNAGTERTNASASLHYGGLPGWSVALSGHLSRDDTDFSFLHFAPEASLPEESRSEVQRLIQDQWIAAAAVNGRLGSSSAGDVTLALGAEIRKEAYAHLLQAPVSAREHISRRVDSAYIEIHVPVPIDLSQVPGASVMKISVAGRYDDYSDFGDIINPKFRLSWEPLSSLEIRGTLSKSFRTPAMGTELLTTSEGTNPSVSIYSFRTADGRGTVPVALLTGSGRLRPERARDWTAGLTLTPSMMEGWKFDVTYYSILFTRRIVEPPMDVNSLSNPALQSFISYYDSAAELQATLQARTAGRLRYVDRTGSDFGGGEFGANPWQLANYVFDARLANTAIVNTSGWDIGVNYAGELGGGDLQLTLNASRICEIETTYAPGAPVVDLVSTVGNPAGLRLSGAAAFTRGGWHGSLSLNFTRDYTDVTSNRPVGSYLTADALLSYTFHKQRARLLDDVSIRFGVKNLWNEPPPYIVGSVGTRGANFDSANAGPLGRFFSLGISKGW